MPQVKQGSREKLALKDSIFRIILIAAFGGILYGFDLGIINGALLFIPHSIPLTHLQASLVASVVLGGGSIATLIAGPFADAYGRVTMMRFSSVIFLIGVSLTIFAHNYTQLIVGRLGQGIGIGMLGMLCPLYISEMMPAHLRGRGVDMFQLLITVGIVLANGVGWYFAQSANWRAMFGAAFVLGLLFFVGAWFLPKSPYWLVMKHQTARARQLIERYLFKNGADSDAFFQELEQEGHVPHQGVRELFKPRYRRILLLVFAAAILTQATGINSLLSYTAIILKAAGDHGNVSVMLGSILMTSLNVVATCVAMFLIDRVGRRPLLLTGLIGIIISLLANVGISFLLPDSQLKADWTGGFLMAAMIFYAIGPGAVVYLLISELLPTAVRSNGMSVSLFLNGLTSGVVATIALPIASRFGFQIFFLICAIFVTVYLILAFWKIPETKNKSLEEIEQLTVGS